MEIKASRKGHFTRIELDTAMAIHAAGGDVWFSTAYSDTPIKLSRDYKWVKSARAYMIDNILFWVKVETDGNTSG